MKANIQTLFTVLTVIMTLSLINCSSGSSNNTPTSTNPYLYGTSCGGSGNMIQSQYGCLPSCGVSSVLYQGQCVPVTTAGGVGGYGSGYGGGYGSQICQGSCQIGTVQTQMGCLPQGSCGPCYGYAQGGCYIGYGAQQYYSSIGMGY
jgi:hypothetical protein